MKRKLLIPFVLPALCCILFFNACIKYPPITPDNNVPNDRLLKTWQLTSNEIPTNTYQFYYNNKKLVDSIVLSQGINFFTYRVHRKHNGQIDSVVATEYLNKGSGHVYFVARNYQYSNGLITHYDYHVYDNFGNHDVMLFDISHEQQKMTIRYNTIAHEFTFNDKQDVVRMRDNGDRPFNGTFSYNTGINPLFYARDLYAIITDLATYNYEYLLSKHNTVKKNYNDGYSVNYTHIYDDKGRLTRSDFKDVRHFGTQSFSYTYY
ncbi:hypothetical protein [Chitinophaga qingshengii]|uniref:DUF4595 domain-containing protein n=1 Tax=Chitinophaga qingshengii TaxID=1569794 RepID=A0ABR7THQ6_9BACT|nr:hypothetical protein [Chitinophaga qingshengii]MBC9930038.1 hypothetical protein [Chitinophaga qingshengii]